MKTIDGKINFEYQENQNKLPLEHLPDLSDVDLLNGGMYCAKIGLTSAKGFPKKVIGSVFINNNRIATLEGSPRTVIGHFQCSRNKLTSLIGAPETIVGTFDCSHNQLTSLDGCPKQVSGNFYCVGNPGKFTEEQIRAVCDVKGVVMVKQS